MAAPRHEEPTKTKEGSVIFLYLFLFIKVISPHARGRKQG